MKSFNLPISNLQLALIVAGVLLVIGVILYNQWPERRVRRRIEAAFRPTEEKASTRVEPTLRGGANDAAEAVSHTRTAPAAALFAGSPSTGPGRQGGDHDVVDVGMQKTMRTTVVLEGGDHPALGLDRREPAEARVLQELERRIVC